MFTDALLLIPPPLIPVDTVRLVFINALPDPLQQSVADEVKVVADRQPIDEISLLAAAARAKVKSQLFI